MTGARVRRRGPQGFTLIEIVVVMLVVGLAAAVVVPGVGRGVDAFRVRAEVSGFSSFLRYAREQAVIRRVSQEVRVDPEARLVVLTAAGSERPRASRRIGQGIRVEAPGGRVYTVTVDALTGRVVNRRGDA